MKKRRSIIIAFILAAILVMGVGYAALTDMLTIEGEIKVPLENANDAFDELVYFSSAEASNAQDTIEINTSVYQGDTVDIFINSLAIKDQTATFTMKIQNDFENAVTVTPAVNNLGSATSADWLTFESNWSGQAKTIASGGFETYILTVTLGKTPTEEELMASFQIDFDVTTATTTSAS